DLGAEGFGKAVASRIGVTLPVRAATRREVGKVVRQGYRIGKLVFETEKGIEVPGLLFEPGEAAKKPLVLYVDGAGKAGAAAVGGSIERLVLAGRRVLAVDLRGWGETAPAALPKRPGYFGVDVREAFLGLHLDRPLLGQRVRDLLAVLEQ